MKRCFYCKRRTRVRFCRECRHYVCGRWDCPGSPCPEYVKRGRKTKHASAVARPSK